MCDVRRKEKIMVEPKGMFTYRGYNVLMFDDGKNQTAEIWKDGKEEPEDVINGNWEPDIRRHIDHLFRIPIGDKIVIFHPGKKNEPPLITCFSEDHSEDVFGVSYSGSLPESEHENIAKMLVTVYQRGFEKGEERGRWKKQREICWVLGAKMEE